MTTPKHLLEAAEKAAEKLIERYNHKDPWVQYEMRKFGKLSFAEGIEWLFGHLCELSEQVGLTSYWSDEKRRYDADAVDVIRASDMAALLKARSERDKFEADFKSNYQWRINLAQELEAAKAEIAELTERGIRNSTAAGEYSLELDAAKQEIARLKDELKEKTDINSPFLVPPMLKIQQILIENGLARVKELQAALKTLRNEVKGTLSAHELAIRYDSGNSNWVCLELALKVADKTLKGSVGEG